MRRRFVKRSAGVKPARQWISIDNNWLMNEVTTTTANILMRLEMPTNPTNLTSDPPEDLTVLRVVGNFWVAFPAAASVGSWRLVLMVQDVAWTPAAFPADEDKRILWAQTYHKGTAENVAIVWGPPGMMQVNSTPGRECGGLRDATRIDITPKVKLEAGKALYLVAYELSDGVNFTTLGAGVRLLYQRTRRR